MRYLFPSRESARTSEPEARSRKETLPPNRKVDPGTAMTVTCCTTDRPSRSGAKVDTRLPLRRSIAPDRPEVNSGWPTRTIEVFLGKYNFNGLGDRSESRTSFPDWLS